MDSSVVRFTTSAANAALEMQPLNSELIVALLTPMEEDEQAGKHMPSFDNIMGKEGATYSISTLPHLFKRYVVLGFEQLMHEGDLLTLVHCRHPDSLEKFKLWANTGLKEILEGGMPFPFFVAIEPNKKCGETSKRIFHKVVA